MQLSQEPDPGNLKTLRVRPRFRVNSPLSKEELINRFKTALANNTQQYYGEVIQNHVVLTIPRQQRRFWSPQLTLEVDSLDEKGTLVRGLVGPRPAVWTMLVFFYSSIGFLTMLGTMFGISQWILGMSAWAFWILPLGLILIGLLYGMSQVGQRMSRDQTVLLYDIMLKEINN